MWICLNKAFLSVVRKDGKPNELCVRARRREHINNVFPNAKVIKTVLNDYRYRAFIDEKEVAQAISNEILGIDYGNFKKSVKDKELQVSYSRFWGLMYVYQDDEKGCAPITGGGISKATLMRLQDSMS